MHLSTDTVMVNDHHRDRSIGTCPYFKNMILMILFLLLIKTVLFIYCFLTWKLSTRLSYDHNWAWPTGCRPTHIHCIMHTVKLDETVLYLNGTGSSGVCARIPEDEYWYAIEIQCYDLTSEPSCLCHINQVRRHVDLYSCAIIINIK